MAIEVGQQMDWHQVVSNYGDVNVRRVTVLKVGDKRVTIEVPMRRGGTRRTRVTPARLHPLPSEEQTP